MAGSLRPAAGFPRPLRATCCVVCGKSAQRSEVVLSHELVLNNATFRLLEVAPVWTRYLVLDFRASAVSDDKRDWMVRLGINLATGALPDAVISAIAPVIEEPPFGGYIHRDVDESLTPADLDLPADWDRPKFLSLVARALPPRLHGVVDPFVQGSAAPPRSRPGPAASVS